MSTTSSTRRQEPTTSSTASRREPATTSRRPSATTTTTSQETPKPTTLEQQFSLIQLDTGGPTPSATTDLLDDVASATASSFLSKTTCASDSDCDGDKICSKGVCAKVIDAAPFGPAGGSSLEPTSHMSTGGAIGVGLGVVSFMLLMFGLGIWLWRRRGRKSLNSSIEAPPTNRNRSASSATDQKTLVASLPNSPQYAGFREQRDQMLTASFAQLVTSNKIFDHNRTEKEKTAYGGGIPIEEDSRRKSRSNEKRLPLPPNDMPLPPRPTEEKKYAVNVNINKSMIFDDVMFNMASTPRDTGTPRESGTPRNHMPKYRFEEYHPPITSTPPISIRQISSKRTSEIEMKPYPRKGSSSTVQSSSDDEEDAETGLKRKSTLKKLESKPPQLPLPELLPPPSPSFSFKSYDWYQDIIGTEQTNMEDTVLGTSAPLVPDRNPNRTPTQATFGAALSSNPPDLDATLMPAPLSPSKSSFLHPSSAALASPTSTNFRLSPTVYVMPSKPPKAQPMRASLRSTMTQKTHMSRSWLPDDGLYLPEEGTHDSYMMFKRRLSDDSRPTSYSPL
jgi:hypothetical protein